MNIVLRHVIVGIFYSLFVSIVMMGITLLAFPPKKWSLLFEQEILDMPFLLLALIMPVLIGTVIGISLGLYWRRRLHKIERHLDELIKGQPVTVDEDPEKELTQIQANIEQLQDKLHKQTEHAQHQATERTQERRTEER